MVTGRRTKTAISYNMSRIKASGSEIEKIVASALCKEGLRGYRKNLKTILGKPDFSWKGRKIAIFCDSSFWHGYRFGKRFKEAIKVRKKFWYDKMESNRKRDKFVGGELRKQGWTVIRFWDFQIKKNIDSCIKKIKKEIEK